MTKLDLDTTAPAAGSNPDADLLDLFRKLSAEDQDSFIWSCRMSAGIEPEAYPGQRAEMEAMMKALPPDPETNEYAEAIARVRQWVFGRHERTLLRGLGGGGMSEEKKGT